MKLTRNTLKELIRQSIKEIDFKSQDAFDDVLSGCKKAAKLLGEDGEVEIVDYSGEYEYFNNLIDG